MYLIFHGPPLPSAGRWLRIYPRSQASHGQPSPPRPPPRQNPQQRIRPCNHRADDDGDDQAPTVHWAHLLSMAHRLRSSHRFSHQSSPQTPPTTTTTTITMTSPSRDTAWGSFGFYSTTSVRRPPPCFAPRWTRERRPRACVCSAHWLRGGAPTYSSL